MSSRLSDETSNYTSAVSLGKIRSERLQGPRVRQCVDFPRPPSLESPSDRTLKTKTDGVKVRFWKADVLYSVDSVGRKSFMENVNYIDQLRVQAGASKALIIAALAGMFLLLVGLRMAPEDSTPFTGKVLALLAPTLATASAGAYFGRRISGWLPIIGLFLLSIAGLFVIRAAGGGDLALLLPPGWAFIYGIMLGPL